MSRRANHKSLPQNSIHSSIESFSHDLRGVTHVNGKAVFVDGALPYESVEFVYTLIKRDFAEGRVNKVVSPSRHRIEPRCPHFGVCGGCSLQHLDESEQILAKQRLLIEQFRRLGKVEPEQVWPALTGPVWNYRHKARLGVKWVAKKGKVLVGFREKGSALVADLSSCPVMHPSVGEHLKDIAAMIGALSIRNRVPQIEVAVGDERAALVFRVLEQPSGEDLDLLRAFGQSYGFDVHLQPGGPDSVYSLWPENPPLLNYSLPDAGIRFRFRPTDFTQVNVEINRNMVARVMEALDPQPDEDVLDLFCGIGNFSLPLSRRSASVVGVEGNPLAVERARQNAVENGIQNLEFHVADLTQPQDSTSWANRRYQKVLLDPSRAGAMEMLDYAGKWGASRIVYVSCNPSTLARDAGILVNQQGYRLTGAGVMDMFPHTSHVESIALFER